MSITSSTTCIKSRGALAVLDSMSEEAESMLSFGEGAMAGLYFLRHACVGPRLFRTSLRCCIDGSEMDCSDSLSMLLGRTCYCPSA